MSIESKDYDPRIVDTRPVIREFNESVVVLGTTHWTDIRAASDPATERYKQIVKSVDHLLMEGKKRHYDEALRMHGQGQMTLDYEMFAYRTFLHRGKQEDVHFLEDNGDDVSLGGKYGLPLEDIVGLRVTNDFGRILNYEGGFEAGINAATALFRDNFPAMAQMEEEAVKSMTSGMIDGICAVYNKRADMKKVSRFIVRDPVEKFFTGANAVTAYLGRCREYESLGPHIARGLNSLEGSKAIIVGETHIPLVEKVYSGQQVPKPELWHQHVSNMPRNVRTAVAYYQKVLREIA